MTQKAALKAAKEFLEAYEDPEIDKRLYFDVWADREGLTPVQARRVWQEVRRLAHRAAAEKRRQTWRSRRTRAALGPISGVPGDGRGRRPAT